MRKMISLVALWCAFATVSLARPVDKNGTDLVDRFNDLANRWALISYDIGTYNGLKKYCQDQAYRTHVIGILNDIHHYDSLLYDGIKEKSLSGTNHEIKKVLHQIEAFEEKYKASSFAKTLHGECSDQRSLERNYDELKNDIAANSYDSQAHVLEAHLHSYVKHITRLMDHINEHIHHLHIE